MIQAAAIPMYFMIEYGTPFMEGDEYYDYTKDSWCKISNDNIGREHVPTVNNHVIVARRRNPEFKHFHKPWI